MADDATLTFGYGFQDPTDSADDFAVTCFIVRRMIAQLDTMKLVQVIAVTGGGVAAGPGTVDVLPLVSQVDGAGNAQPHGVVHGIPWTRWQGGTSAFVLDPVVDDVGWVACADRDISVVKESGKQSPPGSYRTYSVADGVYVGGVLGPTPTQYIALLANGFDFLDISGNRIQSDSNGIEVTSALATFSGGVEAAYFELGVGGTKITRLLAGSITTGFGTNIAAFGTNSVTGTVTGAKVGDYVIAARPANGAPSPFCNLIGYVSASDTVTLTSTNTSNVLVTQLAGTYQIIVIGTT